MLASSLCTERREAGHVTALEVALVQTVDHGDEGSLGVAGMTQSPEKSMEQISLVIAAAGSAVARLVTCHPWSQHQRV